MPRLLLLALALSACDDPKTNAAHDAADDAATTASDVPVGRCPELPALQPQADTTACAGDEEPCVVRDDCCNSRHSCIEGVCRY